MVRKILIKKICNKTIENKLSKSVKFIIEDRFACAKKNDEKLLSFLEKMEKLCTLFNVNLSAKVLTEYVKALDKVQCLQRDANEINGTADLFSHDLINKGVTSRIFNHKSFVEYVKHIMLLNVRMARLDSYREIYNCYIKKFDDFEKAAIIKELFKRYCGDISYEGEIIPLMERCEQNAIEMQNLIEENPSNKRYRKKLVKYIYNVIYIADCTFYNLEIGVDLITKQIENFSGIVTKEIVSLMKLALRKDRCIDEIKDWLATIDVDSYNSDVKELKSIIQEIETGELQKKETKEYDKFTAGWVKISQKDKKISKDEILDRCIETEKIIEEKILKEKNIHEKLKYLWELFDVRYRLNVQRYWAEFNRALEKIETSREIKGVFFFHSDWDLVNGSYSLPLLMEAKKRGFICIPSSPITFDFDSCKDELLNTIAGSRYNETYSDKVDSHRWRYNWKIDIENKIIEAEGLNIYEPIYEVISRWQFSCFYNFETNAWARARTSYFIEMFEKSFYQCELLERWARENEKPVRIISTSPHVKTYAAYRIYCEVKGYKHNMEYICARSGYDDYFSNNISETQTLTALNMTKNANSRTPIYGTKAGFEKYYNHNKHNINRIKKMAEQWFSAQRSVQFKTDSTEDDKKRALVLEKITSYKKSGKKVYLMNGKLIFDLGVKYTKGCVHEDLSHWATHTVNTIKNNKDILLIIKPHPHETKKEITMTDEAIDSFKDIIKTSLSDNILYIEGHLFRNVDLAKYMDVCITWNSTSSLELAALGKKVVMGDEWGYLDYPIGFIRFNDINEYERFLNYPDEYEQSKDLQDKAVMFLSYIGSNDINMSNPYTETTTSNYHIFERSKINLGEIDKYINDGDARLERMFDEVM